MSDTQDADSMVRMMGLARLLADQAALVAELTEELKTAEREFARTEQEDLPQLMRELGLTELKLTDGSKIVLTEDLKCGIPEALKPKAFKWLKEHGFSGLIKAGVSIELGRGEVETAEELLRELESEYPTYQLSSENSVHHSTLKAFVKEQLANGAGIPMDLFGVFPFDRAKILPAKVKK